MLFLLKLLLSPKTMLGVAVGAAAVWFTDPEHGGERRQQALEMLRERGVPTPAGSFGVAPTVPASTTADREPTEPALWTPGQPTPKDAPEAAAG